jgi:hypothetical protein
MLKFDELGDSESILRNKRYLKETVQRLMRRGIVPQEDGWNGWLGRYQKALGDAAVSQRFTKNPERERRRDHGR